MKRVRQLLRGILFLTVLIVASTWIGFICFGLDVDDTISVYEKDTKGKKLEQQDQVGIQQMEYVDDTEISRQAYFAVASDNESRTQADMISEGVGNTVSILAVGDDLIHTPIISSGKQEDGTYDFNHLFDGIRTRIKAADVAIINQETILCDEKLGYSGYPLFGSPFAIGQAVANAGFDVILHATNHTFDKGYQGIYDTLNFWNAYEDIQVAGINKSGNQAERVSFVKRNGITISILNYTYGLNGLSLSKDKSYLVNQLNERELMKKDIAYAKKMSDFVIVCPHWGNEYIYEPSEYQTELVDFFLEEKVDLILGTHPHVLQPVKWYESADGTHRMLVYYSLGNYISNQDNYPCMLGGMAEIKIIRTKSDVVIDLATITPLVTHRENTYPKIYTTYQLEDYSDDLASRHALNSTSNQCISLEKLMDLSNQILGEWYVVLN